MEKIKRFFECALPITACNIKCSYCYVIQEARRSMKIEELQYPPEYVAKALSKKRLGGVCLFNICGSGETLAHPQIVDLVKCILEEGHYVSITTNGTLTNKFEKIVELCKPYLDHLHVAFSLHYVELLNRNWLDRFFNNVNLMKNAGASILVQINMCDEYMPHIEEIQRICLEKVGAYPQVALTRNEETEPMTILTNGTVENYIQQGRKFSSPLFEFTVKNFMQKRKEFCYAGDWSGVLNLLSGDLAKCYRFDTFYNVYENIDEPIPFGAIGKNCINPFCFNSSHFMSLGIIPEIKTPTYAFLRNRPEGKWYRSEMEEFLSGKLENNNKKYNLFQKCKANNGKLTLRGLLGELTVYQKLHDLKSKKR